MADLCDSGDRQGRMITVERSDDGQASLQRLDEVAGAARVLAIQPLIED
jgi:hypothetical protein